MRNFTEEQNAVIHDNSPILLVNAFAGTGKTTLVEGYAAARPRQRFLAMYKHKLGNLKPYTIATQLRLDYTVAGDAIRLIENFCSSTATTIEECVTDRYAPQAATAAEHLWSRMCDVNDATICMTHDGYLKLFQLSAPTLNFDGILFDEVQDSNPVTSAIVGAQHCPKLYVGDRHQQIYAFRGAVDAMDILNGQRHYLTQSFRFGPSVAAVANAILAEKDETHPLKGAGPESIVNLFGSAEDFDCAIISRTNAGVFVEAVLALQAHPERRISFVGGMDGYRFNLIEDGWRLKSAGASAVLDRYIKSFQTYARLAKVAEETDDAELSGIIDAVETYGDRIPALIEQVRAAEAPLGSTPTIFMTGHKSKGLQFPRVRMLDNFFNPDTYREEIAAKKRPLALIDNDMNIVYVAVTRAQNELILPESLSNWLIDIDVNAPGFHYPGHMNTPTQPN